LSDEGFGIGKKPVDSKSGVIAYGIVLNASTPIAGCVGSIFDNILSIWWE
jgi:hypothetical protein